MSQFSIRRPVTVFMLIIALLIGGGIFALRLPVEQMPDMKLPFAAVVTSIPNATPTEVEELVTKPIEKSLASIENVDTIMSESSEGTSMVMIQFNWGVDINQATLDMRDKVDGVKGSLPKAANSPRVLKVDLNATPVITLSLTGDQDINKLKPIAEDIIEPRLERIAGVAAANMSGGQARLVKITVDQAKLQSYGITLDQISQALSSNNVAGSAGSVYRGNTEIQLRVQGEYKAVSEMGETPIPVGKGSIKLKDIATVEDSLDDVTTISTYNGKPSINISVTKATGGNTLSIADSVKDSLDSIRKELPPGTQLEMVTDASKPISDSVHSLVEHAILGLIIAAIVLLLFLNSIRSTIIATIVIPISFVATFMMMYFTGQTINIISLSGLLLGLGSFVDFAVVIIENIFRQRHEGKSMLQGAIDGSKQVGNAVMASALAQIVVFLPVVFVDGIAGVLFKPLALTVIFSHIAALLVSLMIVPMLGSRWLPTVPDESIYSSGTYKGVNPIVWFNIGFEKFKSGYRRILKWGINHRKSVLIITLLMFVAAGALVPFVKAEFIPASDTGEFTINVKLPNGTVLEETEKVVQDIEKEILKVPDLDKMTVTVGSGGNSGYSGAAPTNSADLSVTLKDGHQATDGVVDGLRKKFDSIPDAEITMASTTGLSSGAAVNINLKGDDIDVLRELSDNLVADVKNIPGTVNVKSTLSAVREEYEITVNRELASRYGLSATQILSAVNTSFNGSVATSYRTGEDQIDVKISLPEKNRHDLSNLKALRITTSQGIDVPLSSVVSIDKRTVPDTVTREDQTRQVQITADIDGTGDILTINQKIDALLKTTHFPEGYSADTGGGQNEQMMESFMNLAIAILLSVVLIYMVMAGQFESLLTPFVIMFSVPPTVIGVLIGLAVTGASLSVSALTGYIMLVGLVVNNAIVMIDFIIQLRKDGQDRDEAIIHGASERLRPILMTTLATVLALLPMAFATGSGNETQAPMAVVVVFGLSFAAVITLILIPVVYVIMDNMIEKRKNRKLKRQAKREQKKEAKLQKSVHI
ncbi:MMPL family transporter [Paenibacillus sp. OT2-17]|jgi:HAE1 family hydrophobic/amphiphilic exporter-1|uniref:efflux RND transporter permease subunit n=1 Tax=unclassified Paenibacillus TaxID=185978 RepID=UPI001354BBE6|nr:MULTISPECIES: efflux RND transporter permease subunit [unclassified Paenibacillus]MBP1173400.1 HAE1 family hydrophobic/amphiphilic exporter-1 [Paenibacillus sp. PvR133]MXO76643.1 MMPL family transporter [Paenibacillus sp. OT2-17]